MATDISVIINPPVQFDLNLQPPNEIDLTISEGFPKHAETHAPGGSDSLSAYYVTGSVVRASDTGIFYPYSSNPNGYVQGAVVRPSNTGAFLDTGSSQTINSLKNFLVRPTVNGTGVLLSGESPGTTNTGSLTGAFYPLNSNPSGYITGVDLTNYVTKSSTGVFVTTGQTGNFITTSQTGQFVSTGATGSFVVSSQTGAFLTTGAADSRYALQSATGAFVTTGQTGSFITVSQTGAFYPNSNPSGFITGVDLSSYATTSYVTGVSGYLQYQISNFSGSSSTGSYVSLTGDETISGIKNFISRPTVNTTGVLISGDAVDTIHLYGKNSESFTLNKGQPVYIGGANGANPLIKRSSNTGESDSSKTIGLLAQDLSVNALGYAITEGILEGFDTSAGAAGDPMWLGSTGQILYGNGNKPYGLNNLVYLGVVLRSQSNNGKVYVKIQNGFEIEELHNVYANNPLNKDSLFYNSGSGAWFARQVNTGDVSGISAYALAANTGSFITVSQTGAFAASALTGAFLTTGAADGRYYDLSNGQSISGYAITGFNDAITGMTITGDTTKVITLFQRGGSTVTGSFTDNAGTGGGGSGSISVNDSNLVISISMFA